MKPARLTQVTHIHCPHCGQRAGSVDYLGPGVITAWVCDFCRFYFRLENKGGEWWVEPTERQCLETVDAVRLDARDVVLFVKGRRFTGPGFDDTPENPTYYYEEHTCPDNVFNSVIASMIDGQMDKHGSVKFIKRVDLDEETRDEHWLYRWYNGCGDGEG